MHIWRGDRMSAYVYFKWLAYRLPIRAQTLIPLLIDSCIALLGRILCACNKSFQINTQISHVKNIYINAEIRATIQMKIKQWCCIIIYILMCMYILAHLWSNVDLYESHLRIKFSIVTCYPRCFARIVLSNWQPSIKRRPNANATRKYIRQIVWGNTLHEVVTKKSDAGMSPVHLSLSCMRYHIVHWKYCHYDENLRA